MVKVLIPIIAILVIVESLVLISKYNSPVVTGLVALKTSTNQPVSMKWNVESTEVKNGDSGEVSLILISDKDVFIDAVDLYVKYDQNMAVMEVEAVKGFVTPSFKKVSPQKGMVVMNYLVSEASGFKLSKGVEVTIAKFKVNYIKSGISEFGIDEGTLVVENGSAKVLPFSSDKLVINVTE